MSLLKNEPGCRRTISGKGFLIPGMALIVAALVLSSLFPKEEIYIFLNGFHNNLMDRVMRAWTFLGDGIFVLVIIFLFLWIRLRISILLLAGYLLSGGMVQLLKRTLFRGYPRPVKYFELQGIDYDFQLVPGIDIHMWNTFPSGHTASAFGLFLGISLFLKPGSLQFLCLLLAAGVAWSRIYLSEHFLTDVTGGAIIGIVFTYCCCLWIERYRSDWMDAPLTKLLRR